MLSYWNFNKLKSQQHLILQYKVLDSDRYLSTIRPSIFAKRCCPEGKIARAKRVPIWLNKFRKHSNRRQFNYNNNRIGVKIIQEKSLSLSERKFNIPKRQNKINLIQLKLWPRKINPVGCSLSNEVN